MRTGNWAFGGQSPTYARERASALDDNHLHAWELDEASGASAFADTGSSAYKVSLSIVDTTKVQLGSLGPFGACAMFGAKSDGTSSATHGGARALVSSFSDLPTTNCTVELWARASQVTTAAQYLFSCDFTASANYQWAIRGSASDDMSMTVRAGTFITPTTTVALHPTTRTAQTWHHYMATYDGSNLRIYADGEIIKTNALTGSINWSNTSGTAPQIVIGDILAASTGFVGWMSRVRISNTVRSQSYARSVYAKGMLY